MGLYGAVLCQYAGAGCRADGGHGWFRPMGQVVLLEKNTKAVGPLTGRNFKRLLTGAVFRFIIRNVSCATFDSFIDPVGKENPHAAQMPVYAGRNHSGRAGLDCGKGRRSTDSPRSGSAARLVRQAHFWLVRQYGRSAAGGGEGRQSALSGVPAAGYVRRTVSAL